MRYKRDESFRYVFDDAISGTFKIFIANDGEERLNETNEGSLKVIDISPGGMKFSTHLDLPLNDKDFLLQVDTELKGEQISMVGKITWKRNLGNHFTYGLDGLENEENQLLIIEQLKKLNK